MMDWISSIENGLLIAVIYYILIVVPIMGTVIAINRKYNVLKIAVNTMFFVYMCCVITLVFFPLPEAGTVLAGYKYQLIPGRFVYDIVKEMTARSVAQVGFNIVMTIPFGAYLAYYWKIDIKKVICFSFGLSLFIEIGQLTGLFFIYDGSYRLCDVDDLFFNTLGGVIGAFVARKCVFLPELSKYDKVIGKPVVKLLSTSVK